MTIHLIRHGQTTANLQKLYCGFTNLPLCASGRQGLLALKASIVYPSAPILVHSGLLRTKETMTLLTGEPEGIPILDLREMDFGSFEMQSYQTLKQQQPYIDWITEKTPAPPQGESRAAFQERVLRGFATLCSLCPKEGSVAAFVHGGVIAVLLETLFPSKRNFYEWQPDFGRGYTITLVDGIPQAYQEI